MSTSNVRSASPHEAGAAAGRKTTIAAFAANFGITVAKLLAWVVTGSAAMLAETVHSVADTGNQGLLLIGRRRSQRGATARHPFGHGRERFFWAFVVAMVLFSGGALFALVEGEEKLRQPHELTSPGWAIAVLLIAFALESWSLRTAVRESTSRKHRGESWLAFVRRTSVPELAVVLLEDSGALLGVTLALVGTVLASAFHNPRYDALGSIGIGILLAAIAITLASEMKSLLIGEAAHPRDVDKIAAAIEGQAFVNTLDELRTEQLGPDEVLVVGTIHVEAGSVPDLDAVRSQVESAVRATVPSAKLVYLRAKASTPDAAVDDADQPNAESTASANAPIDPNSSSKE